VQKLEAFGIALVGDPEVEVLGKMVKFHHGPAAVIGDEDCTMPLPIMGTTRP